MNTQTHELTFKKIDIATGNLQEMVAFYTDIFGVEFQESPAGKWTLYVGNLGGLKFLLSPNEPAGTEANQLGVHQFHLRVAQLREFVESVRAKGVDVFSVSFEKDTENYSLRDPDGNPWILSAS